MNLVNVGFSGGFGFRLGSAARNLYTFSPPRVLWTDIWVLGGRTRRRRKLVHLIGRSFSCANLRISCSSADSFKMASPSALGEVEAAFGSWSSPITADLVSASTKRTGGMAVDSQGRLIWCEGRPWEGGRYVLMREGVEPGKPEDITPEGYNVRTVVHEYGGGAFAVGCDILVFSNHKDQRLYKQPLNADRAPVALTRDYGEKKVRYADGVIDERNNRYITVREGETLAGVEAGFIDERVAGREAKNEIVVVQLDGDPNAEPEVLITGNDFYAYPRISPDGKRLCWMEWSHPNMPWDKTSIWVGDITSNGDVANATCIAGGDEGITEAPSEPRWSPTGELYFVSDRNNGWWNLYCWESAKNKVEPLYRLEAEFTRPLWTFGNSNFGFIVSKEPELQNKVVCIYRQRGVSVLGLLDLSTRSFSAIETPFSDIFGLTTAGEYVYISAGSTFHPECIAKVKLLKNRGVNEYSLSWTSFEADIENFRPYISVPQVLEFQTKVEGETAFVNFYPPMNADYKPPPGEKPPLLVRSHGGPTGEAKTALSFSYQYWTSRGWAIADVNYSGSTGYGRSYRERLHGQWGVRDVGDCCSCAEFLAKQGLVDSKRLCIDGRSAGGYTTIASMVFSDTFAAGCSMYGLSDLSGFGEETHKFESRYVDILTGADKDKNALYNRSPINFIQNFSCPIILFQGLDDKVVPPNQARLIYEAVKRKGLPVALIEYEGEQHGFLKAENIKNTLEQEMTFFARVIGGFKVADNITPVPIDNFDG